MPSNGRQHPALAAVAARAASAGSPAVLFNVVHFGARTTSAPQAQVTGTSPPTAQTKPATETLAFNIAGIGFRVHTWAPNVPSKPDGGVDARRILPIAPVVNDRGITREVYAGAVVINPNFLYDSSQSIEFLITIGHRRWKPDYGDALMIATIYQRITAAAALSHNSILFLQSPVAPFKEATPSIRQDGSGENPRLTNGMVLRMVVGLDDNRPQDRLQLLRALSAAATEFGLGLQVGDRRFGRVRGEWWTVLQPHSPTYKERKAALYGFASAELPEAVQLLTFVGPARSGSSAAIANDLLHRNIGIVAISEALLQDIAFINVVVPVAPARRSDEVPSGSCLPIAEGLGLLARDCGLTKRTELRGKSVIEHTPATDYQLLATGPLTVRVEESAARKDRALWVYWDLPVPATADQSRQDIAQLVLTQLLTADTVGHARVDYYRARVSPAGRIRGIAKFAVSLSDGITDADVGDALSRLSPWAQREVISQMVKRGVPIRGITLRVVWRERWLGQADAHV